MLRNRFTKVLIFFVAIPFFNNAQTRSLSLQEALNLAAENNLNIKSAEARINAAKASYRMTNSVFLPGIEASHTGVSTNDPLSAFGFKLKQEIVQQADFDPARLNDPGSSENFGTKLEIQQPLLNLDGIYARKAAKSQFEAMNYQATRVRKNIEYEVKRAYFMLELAESSVEVLGRSVKVAEEALRLTKNNEEQGFAKHADVLEASVRYEERNNQLQEAKNNREAAHDFLAHLLGLEFSEQITTTDSLVQPPAQLLSTQTGYSIENRSDVLAFQKQIEAGENMVKSNKMKFVPRVNAFGAVEWNDDKLLGTSANNYIVGASLSWKLFNGYKNAGAVQQSRAQLDEAKYNYQDYLSQSQIQVNNAIRKVNLNYNRIQSSKLAKEQANESLRIRTNRFEQGLEKTADLLMSEALASGKELEYIQSIYNYKQAIFEMELLLEKDINE
ncbi:TolC family protein [Maribellus sp. YY47]|uniref:TolC family protein n=1 Tax=Maribellus sp. YY47 TaxID=2929486 RepID=UPI002001A6C3|nr:TolC family protein [Maribellus sp. YY47]MCK3684913.1 TolC family protein [Maribellus sp. YY47]